MEGNLAGRSGVDEFGRSLQENFSKPKGRDCRDSNCLNFLCSEAYTGGWLLFYPDNAFEYRLWGCTKSAILEQNASRPSGPKRCLR